MRYFHLILAILCAFVAGIVVDEKPVFAVIDMVLAFVNVLIFIKIYKDSL
jgi:hypothetical protein